MFSRTMIFSAAFLVLAGSAAPGTARADQPTYCWVTGITIANRGDSKHNGDLKEVRARAYNPLTNDKVNTTIGNARGNPVVPWDTQQTFNLKELGAAKNGWEFFVDFADTDSSGHYSCERGDYRLVYDAVGNKGTPWDYKFTNKHRCLPDPASKKACVEAPVPKDALITR